MIGQAVLPTLGNQTGVSDGVRIRPQGERNNVGLQAVDDGPRLTARSAVRLADGNTLARFALVDRLERIV